MQQQRVRQQWVLHWVLQSLVVWNIDVGTVVPKISSKLEILCDVANVGFEFCTRQGLSDVSAKLLPEYSFENNETNFVKYIWPILSIVIQFEAR